MTVTVHNLATTDRNTLTFVNVSPEWAVRYAYAQENRLVNKLLASTPKELERDFPVRYGKKSVTCEDWAALL